jgi:hypothetical protein
VTVPSAGVVAVPRDTGPRPLVGPVETGGPSQV